MLLTLKIVLLVMSVLLIVVVLLQKGKSAGLSGAITGGAEHLFTNKRQARGLDLFLSRATLILAISFIVVASVVAFSDQIPWLAEKSEKSEQTTTAPPANNAQEIQVTTPPADAQKDAGSNNTKVEVKEEPAKKSTEPAKKSTEPAN
jgi:preprotein translocase subunit SecG